MFHVVSKIFEDGDTVALFIIDRSRSKQTMWSATNFSLSADIPHFPPSCIT
jgi:hypothetical protein